ncbi:MAG: VacB/RNase II family 3'-5' exoribonuclease [Candidatus Cloacimonadaceae bacterium]|jgi:ribonuclease R|nr:VacB/RNase II family 3'-5' exoribonuclease [Candidatus Cloacimonadota bacterium]MDY0336270.1 VacB/RNase II family 3'-5' exoribonuclease [Candidatus Cloacimonadaceae bacterium]
MEYNNIESRIIETLSVIYPKGLTYSEICAHVGSTKKNKHEVSQYLAQACEQGKIIKRNKRYSLTREVSQEQPSSPLPSNPQKTSAKLIEGIFDATSLSRDRSFAFVRSEERDFFIDSEDTMNAYHGDKVLIEPHSRKGREYGIVRRIVTRANTLIPGDIAKVKNRWIFTASNPKIHNWFEINDLGGAEPGQKVILSVTNWGLPMEGKMPRGNITEILGLSGDPQVELLAVIRQYDLPLVFPDEVLEEVKVLPVEPIASEIARRRDLRELFTFTIDPASAKDFDDAISIQRIDNGWRLWVHIADVAHYLPVESKAFIEASKRGNSFYFPKKVIPMLPERLSNLICSLRPEEDKLTMTVETAFDFNGKVKQQTMYESVIRSDHRLAYEEVDDLFDGKAHQLSPTLVQALQEARMLSRQLSRIRRDAGYIFFDLPEIEYEYDEEGFVHHLGIAEETESHKLIENFMLVANEYTAEMLSLKAPSAIYRIHDDPDERKIEKLIEILSFYGIGYIEQENMNKSVQRLLDSLPDQDYHRVFDRIILRSMKKAKYAVEHVRHFGLALENYTHFTSPIRRLCDLVVHHLCKSYVMKTGKSKLDTAQIKHWAAVASEQELQADSAERDIERVYSATYMKDRIGELYSGLVISANSSGVIVRLNEMPVSAILKKDQFGRGRWEYREWEMRHLNPANNQSFELLDTVKVRIMEVSDDIYLELSGEADDHRHYHRVQRPAKPRKARNKVDARPTIKKVARNPKKTGRR